MNRHYLTLIGILIGTILCLYHMNDQCIWYMIGFITILSSVFTWVLTGFVKITVYDHQEHPNEPKTIHYWDWQPFHT